MQLSIPDNFTPANRTPCIHQGMKRNQSLNCGAVVFILCQPYIEDFNQYKATLDFV